ncbi:MAG: Bug family tripartite tricarboxylate transporter substrate binding protein [Burkholderiales bacterium]
MKLSVIYRAWRHTWTVAALCMIAILTCPFGAWAQSAYPSKPVRLIVPFAPGGVTDLMARLVAERMSRSLGQSMFVENRAGASGNIGASAVASAPPDGYTLLLGFDGTLVINPHLLDKVPFDSVKDFDPIGRIGYSVSMLVAHPSTPAKTLAEVIALSKATAGGLSYGTSGAGGSMHLAGELLKQRSGANLVHVPFKGSAPATLAVVAGEIPIALVAIGGAQAHLRSGKLTPIAVPAGRRSASFPNVATFMESGIADYSIASWFGILTAARSPRVILDRLSSELNTILKDPEIVNRLAAMDVAAAPGSPDEFAEEIRRDLGRFGAIVKSAALKNN